MWPLDQEAQLSSVSTDEQTEAQRGDRRCSRSTSRRLPTAGLRPSMPPGSGGPEQQESAGLQGGWSTSGSGCHRPLTPPVPLPSLRFPVAHKSRRRPAISHSPFGVNQRQWTAFLALREARPLQREGSLDSGKGGEQVTAAVFESCGAGSPKGAPRRGQRGARGAKQTRRTAFHP